MNKVKLTLEVFLEILALQMHLDVQECHFCLEDRQDLEVLANSNLEVMELVFD